MILSREFAQHSTGMVSLFIMNERDQVILVDSDDRPIGTAEKLSAHQQGLLHRAFSIFIFTQAAGQLELLLQQRNVDKYHSGGLWTNTCCSHPRPNESTLAAAQRRLSEEMGLQQVALQEVGGFCYRAVLDNQLIEHEWDHLFIGIIDYKTIHPNYDEAADYCWLTIPAIQQQLNTTPEKFTAWFAEAFEKILATLPSVGLT